MPQKPGTRLGHYEIQEPIGAGGMGEVYKARDIRLDRFVALKILPEQFSSNDQLKQRFDREAKVISNLSHPNICALFDVGSENGVDFLVMEYLEGETLAERLTRGSLSAEETLRVGIQIADALQAAHREGVVHRDLKPGNVMLTRGGAKLLDFGLAKTAAPGSDSVHTALPTAAGAAATDPLTKEGSILGTFQYMAPEQLEGKEADARSDIFALGAVLYEMATGLKAFQGDSQASLIAKIMSSEPRPISEVQNMSPPALNQLIRSCLTKDPEERIQTAHDVKLQLKWITEAGSSAGMPAPVTRRRRVRSRLAWALAGVFFLTTAFFAFQVVSRSEKPAPLFRASILPPAGGSFNLETPNQAISPDGTRLAFVAADSSGQETLWIRPLSSLDAEQLPGTEDANLPFWSPDGRQVGFFVETQLKRVTVSGERRVQTVCSAASGRGGTWNQDGTILFCPASAGPLFRVSATGGTPVQVTVIDTTKGETAHRFPQFLPDGDHFIYVSIPPGPDGHTIQFASLSDPEPTTLLTADGAAVFAPPGYLLFGRDGSLFAQAIDPVKGRVEGEAVALPERTGGVQNYNGAPAVSVSFNQVLAYPQSGRGSTQFEWFERDGRSLGTVPIAPGNYSNPELSVDERRVAIEGGDSGATDIWIVDTTSGLSSRLTFEPSADAGAPTWSTDEKRIYFGADGETSRNIYWKYASGAGRRELFVELPGVFNNPLCISPDGKTMVVRSLRKETGEDLLLVSLTGEPDVRPFLDSRFNEMNGSFSPDGKWIAYRSDESGRFEMYVQSYPEPTAKYRISPGGAGSLYYAFARPIWAKGGRELIYLSGDGMTVVATEVTPGENFQTGSTQVLFKLPREHQGFTSRDGVRILACVPSRESVTSNLTVVTDWTRGLESP